MAGSVSEIQLDRIYGTIYGNCIGDAIGLLTEFMTKDEAKLRYGKHKHLEYQHKFDDRHRKRWCKGDWTDDSDQMILMMQSILDKKGEVVPLDYGRKLDHWSKHGFVELGDNGGYGLGETTRQVLMHAEFRKDPQMAAKDVWERHGCASAPNGAVMRTSVMGIYKFDNLESVFKNTLEFCRVTHADPRCQASCVAVTIAIALMLQGQHYTASGDLNVNAIIDEAFQKAETCLPPDYPNRKDAVADLKKYMYARTLTELQLDDSRSIGYTYKALGAGFWALRQYDFREALQAITMEAGDADTNGAVAGALLGCKLGKRKLPDTWLDGLVSRNKHWLDDIIQRFLSLSFTGSRLPPNVRSVEHGRSTEFARSGNSQKAPSDKEAMGRNRSRCTTQPNRHVGASYHGLNPPYATDYNTK